MVLRRTTTTSACARRDRTTRRLAAAALSFAIGARTSPASATPPYEPETYRRFSLSAGGNYFGGNLNQIAANLQGNLGLSSPTYGVDVRFNAYRLWGKPTPKQEFRVLGDDAYVNALPFWYFVKRAYVIGLASYDSSQLETLDRRVTVGTGVGYAPARSKTFLLRGALATAFEYSQHDEHDFRLDVPHDAGERFVGRLALLSNGWLRMKDGPVSLRYVTMVLPNLADVRDVRFNFDGQIDVKITEPLSFRVTQIVQYDAATVRAREPLNLRATFGLAWTTK
ncbi:MAG: DUF481 domain-containing protein [Deltaproteobacteria bacterium]|nr:DUF481 domain-containing protein [Deltaproteobacteria bacterium]